MNEEKDYHINLEEEKGTDSPKNKSLEEEFPENNFKNNIGGESSNHQLSSNPEERNANNGSSSFFQIKFYEQFFRATQTDVLNRMKLSFIPFKPEFFEEIGDNPDFYGPFWLLTTIIFLVSSTGNLSRYFYNLGKDVYIFKLELVRYAVLVVYCFGFGAPIVLYFILKFLGARKPSLPELICLYGYSFSCFIPIFLLCIIPVSVIEWLLITYGLVNTTGFLILNLKSFLSELEQPKMYLMFGLIFGIQTALFLTFKLVFFKLIYEEMK